MAEKLGLGFIDHGRFVKKQNVAVEAKLSSLPRIREKVLDGKISHVSSFVLFAHLVHGTELLIQFISVWKLRTILVSTETRRWQNSTHICSTEWGSQPTSSVRRIRWPRRNWYKQCDCCTRQTERYLFACPSFERWFRRSDRIIALFRYVHRLRLHRLVRTKRIVSSVGFRNSEYSAQMLWMSFSWSPAGSHKIGNPRLVARSKRHFSPIDWWHRRKSYCWG